MGASKGIKKNWDIVGKKFGVLTVTDLKKINGRTQAVCLCDCGKIRTCEVKYVKERASKVCGCHLVESASKGGKAGKKHGEGETRLYQIWENIKQRCYNPNYKGYKDYGGRGIKRCEEWSDFLVFKKWAMENGYDDHLTIDRENNNGNYEPSNCRWITNFEQHSNTRKNRKVEHNGEFLHVSEWARRLGTERGDILYHLNKGKSIQDIIDWKSNPIGYRKANKKYQFTNNQVVEMRKMSKHKTNKEIGEIFGTSAANVSRIVRGDRYKFVKDPKLDELVKEMLG